MEVEVDFKSAVKYCEAARSRDESRAYITHFLARDGCLCATDGHRMHIASVDGWEEMQPSVLSAARVAAMLVGDPFDCVNEPLVESYPQVERVVASVEGQEVKFFAGLMRDALAEVMPKKPTRASGIVALPKPRRKRNEPRPPTPKIVVELNPGRDRLAITGPEGAIANVPCRGVLWELHIGFDAKYFKQAVQALEGEVTATFPRRDALGPMMVEDGERRAIVMPVRL